MGEKVKVKALRTGYYDNRRYKPGSVFFMDRDIYQPPNHKPCSWVEVFEGYEISDEGKVVEKKPKRFSKKEE